ATDSGSVDYAIIHATALFPRLKEAEVGGELLEGSSNLLSKLARRGRFQLVLDIPGRRGRQVAFVRPAIQHVPVYAQFIPLALYRGQKLIERHGLAEGLIDPAHNLLQSLAGLYSNDTK